MKAFTIWGRGHSRFIFAASFCTLLSLLSSLSQAQGQFIFATNSGAITITGFSDGIGPIVLTIPGTITGLPVTDIGAGVFEGLSSKSVSIPNSVTNIGAHAFEDCANLTNVVFGNRLLNIGDYAFSACLNLTNVIIPDSVTNIGDYAFELNTSLRSVFFRGNAPTLGSNVFASDNNLIAYYLPGTVGWGTTIAGIPTAFWFLPNPLILNGSVGVGGQSKQFGFLVSWATNKPVVVEACTNLVITAWSSLKTNSLTNGWFYFNDPSWTNYPSRQYRLRST